jgi:hypothetical protein
MQVCRTWKLAAMEPTAWVQSEWKIVVRCQEPVAPCDLGVTCRPLIRRLIVTGIRHFPEDELKRLLAGFSERSSNTPRAARLFAEMNQHDASGHQLQTLTVHLGESNTSVEELDQLCRRRSSRRSSV